jgi:hypothetical protein
LVKGFVFQKVGSAGGSDAHTCIGRNIITVNVAALVAKAIEKGHQIMFLFFDWLET